MTKYEQEIIFLSVETQCIQKNVFFLADKTLNFLEKNNIEVDSLKFFLVNYGVPQGGMNTTILSKFESATTLASVLLLMHNINIQLFKDVERFGNYDNQRKLYERE